MEWGRCLRREARGRCRGSKGSIRGKTFVGVVGGRFTRLKVEVDEADAGGQRRKGSHCHYWELGREADEMSLENSLSKSDTVPLVAVVGG